MIVQRLVITTCLPNRPCTDEMWIISIEIHYSRNLDDVIQVFSALGFNESLQQFGVQIELIWNQLYLLSTPNAYVWIALVIEFFLLVCGFNHLLELGMGARVHVLHCHYEWIKICKLHHENIYGRCCYAPPIVDLLLVYFFVFCVNNIIILFGFCCCFFRRLLCLCLLCLVDCFAQFLCRSCQCFNL